MNATESVLTAALVAVAVIWTLTVVWTRVIPLVAAVAATLPG
jgi:hypothetical protein